MQFVPPSRVFQNKVMSAKERHTSGGYDIPGFLCATRTKTGGMASVFFGHPFPRKNFIYNEGVEVNVKAKRISLMIFPPLVDLKKGLTNFLESYLNNYVRLIESVYAEADRIPFFFYEYYSESAKAIWDFTFLFFRRLGISFWVANRLGHIFATILDLDDAYRFRLIDIMSETNKTLLYENPFREIDRLLEIFKERDLSFKSGENSAAGRLIKLAKTLKYLLFIPKVKEAFRFALDNINFEWFQYDEWDSYWSLNRADYNSLGKPIEERKEKQIEFMFDYAEQQNPDKLVKRIDNEDGSVSIVVEEKAKDFFGNLPTTNEV